MIILMSSYDEIAQFYDSVVADPTEKALWLKKLIQKHRPLSKSILELACGTGSILEVLASEYRVVGLDNSLGMLEVARKRLPNVEFIQANMADFSVDQSFDAILCIYDSINHLLKFSEWQSIFEKVAQHLLPGGLFIFDMNTVEFLHRLNKSEPSMSHFNNNTMTIGAEPNQIAITTLKVEVKEQSEDGTSHIYKTDIPETSFAIQKVEEALNEYFEVTERLGELRFTDWTRKDDKIVFVCRLRA